MSVFFAASNVTVTLPKLTRAAFVALFVARLGRSEEYLRDELRLVPAPCDCGESNCRGWVMTDADTPAEETPQP
jgi:hypothetical protein